MSGGVDDWSPEQRLRVELRKAMRAAGKAGEPETFAVLAESEALADVPFVAGEPLCALVRSRAGQRLYFGSTSLYVEVASGFERVGYDQVTACDWIEDELMSGSPDLAAKARLKREHGDRLILHSADGRRWALDHLGRAFQALHNFFQWAVRHARKERLGIG